MIGIAIKWNFELNIFWGIKLRNFIYCLALIICCFSGNALAQLPHGSNEPMGIVDPAEFGVEVSDFTGRNGFQAKSTVNCVSSELAALSGEEFTDYLLDNVKHCLNFLFATADVEVMYSNQNFLNVADTAVEMATSYDGSVDVSNLFYYLRAAYFVNFFNPTLVTIDAEMDAAVDAALNAYSSKADFLTIETSFHGRLLSDWINTADGAEKWADHYETVKSVFAIITPFRVADFDMRLAHNAALFFIFRGQNPDHGTIGDVVGNDPELPGIFAAYALNADAKVNAGWLVDNAVVELGRLLAFPNIRDDVHDAIQLVLDDNVRLSRNWLALVTAIENSDEDCTTYTGEVCTNQALTDEVVNMVFPNTFTHDAGAMEFHTALSEDEIEQIYYQLKEVEAVFFKVTGATTPVTGDVNDKAIFRIYGSKQDYESFHTFLYGLPTNNGGIYIERHSTLYTFDRQPWESRFTLEELARHEYVHYLVGRYLVPGFWGETEMYSEDRMVWVDEGLASFLAGGTQHDNIFPLVSMLGWIQSAASHYTPAQATQVTYADGLLYPYSALLFNYEYHNGSEVFKELTEALRADDVAAYDAARAKVASHSAADFSGYINDWLDNTDLIQVPWKDYPLKGVLPLQVAADVQIVLEDNISDLVTSLSCADMSDLQYGCTMQLSHAVQDSALPLYEIYSEIDVISEAINDFDNENLLTANCYPVLVGVSEHTIRCEGGLAAGSTMLFDNRAPVATSSSYAVIAGQMISGVMSATDPEDDVLTYIVTQPAHGDLVFDSNTGSFTFLADAGFNGVDAIDFWVTDGEFSSSVATVSITINSPQSGNTAPVASNVSINATSGQVTAGNMVASDPEADDIVYSVTTPNNGTLNFNPNNGAFTYTANNGFVGTDQFTFSASDGQFSSNSAVVTISVSAPVGGSSNVAPQASNSSLVVIGGKSLTANMLASDANLDGIVFSATSPQNGQLTYNSISGEFNYVPNGGFFGEDSFTFIVNDGLLNSNFAVVTISVEEEALINTASTSNDNNGGSDSGSGSAENIIEEGEEFTAGGGAIELQHIVVLLLMLFVGRVSRRQMIKAS